MKRNYKHYKTDRSSFCLSSLCEGVAVCVRGQWPGYLGSQPPTGQMPKDVGQGWSEKVFLSVVKDGRTIFLDDEGGFMKLPMSYQNDREISMKLHFGKIKHYYFFI